MHKVSRLMLISIWSSHRSIRRAQKKPSACGERLGFVGTPGKIRTPDPLIRSQMLYPAELRAHTMISI